MSLTIGIEYLNGWALATHPADREQPEWPPHPDRVFMALAAAHFETDGDEEERQALQRLEGQGPPVVFASGSDRRSTVTTFVPVNDDKSPVKKGKSLMPSGSMPIGRDRQPRQFPVAIPHEPTAFLHWSDAQPDEGTRQRLTELCRKVTSIGHSASLVRMWVAEDPPQARQNGAADSPWNRLVPTSNGNSRYRLRVPGPGRLERLAADYRAGLRPASPLWQGYAVETPPTAEPDIPRSRFDENLIVLRQTGGRRFGLISVLKLTAALRNAVMRACPQPPPEWVSGHSANGRPSEADHLAFVPLPHVGRRHADGHLLGLALAIPREIAVEEVHRCLRPLLYDEAGWLQPIRLTFGRLGECDLELDEQQDFRVALRLETWTAADAPAERWATVTPIALDRNPKLSPEEKHLLTQHPAERRRALEADLLARHTAQLIADNCERIGLPRPSDVLTSPVSMFVGAPTAREMPRIERKKDGGQIRHVHAVITFPELVIGPVILGAGRYRGYGLCRPLNRKDRSQ